MQDPTVLLAAMQSGVHIQVGPARSWDEAWNEFERRDSSRSGWHRDGQGNLRIGTPTPHAIKGEPVRFYRLREVGHEFGQVEKVRTTDVRTTGFVGHPANRK